MTKPTSGHPNSGFMVGSGRKAKAQKILEIISESLLLNHPQGYRPKLLDIGTGNGEIAFHLGKEYEVFSVDIIDQRQIYNGYSFTRLENEILPFPNQSFDIIVSNHIIEHVVNADLHLAEISRLIRDDGLVYLATPNRLWPWEVHYRIFFLHYLPAPIFLLLMKRLDRYHEDVFLINWFSLNQKITKDFILISFSERICKWPHQYYMNCTQTIARLLSYCPLWLYRFFTFIHPTFVVVLRKKSKN